MRRRGRRGAGIALCVLFFSIALPLSAQIYMPKLAVLPFDGDALNAREKEDIAALRVIVEQTFLRTKEFIVVPPDVIQEVLREKGITPQTIYEDKNIMRLQGTKLNFLVSGEVDVLDKAYRITLSLLNVDKGTFITSKTLTIRKAGPELKKGTEKLVEEFVASPAFVSDYYALTENGKSYVVGDTGPAGGIIFFVKASLSDGWRYLEAAPADINERVPWGAELGSFWVPSAPGTAAGIGEGGRNTSLILSKTSGKDLTAAEAAGLLFYNGFADWVLPSRDELDVLYRVLAANNVGNFSDEMYWSSTQSSDGAAWYQNFSDGKQYHNGKKSETFRIRPIRAFR
jgi:hypothetical protein